MISAHPIFGTPPAGYAYGGGIVRRRPMSSGGERLPIDHVTSMKACEAMANANRRIMVREGQLVPFLVPKTDRYVIRRSNGHYDVVAGVRLNAEPLSKEAADALAASDSEE